jgi:hypothetical protein
MIAMASRDAHAQDVERIRSIANTKGVDIDDIEVSESDGGSVVFRVFSDSGPKFQIAKSTDMETDVFRDQVQRKMSRLRQYIQTDGTMGMDEIDGGAEERGADADTTSADRSTARTNSTRTVSGGAGPGAELDALLDDIDERLDEIESRLDDIEDKAAVLDGLQSLMDNKDSS